MRIGQIIGQMLIAPGWGQETMSNIPTWGVECPGVGHEKLTGALDR